MQADTDENLAETGRRQRLGSTPLLTIGGAMMIIGAILLLIEGDAAFFIGISLLFLGAIPATAGAGLFLSGLIARRASKRRPFA